MATRSHAHTRYLFPEKFERREEIFTNCSLFDAIVSMASQVDWLATHPGRITIAGMNGLGITRVWNAEAYSQRMSDPNFFETAKGPVRFVGHFAVILTEQCQDAFTVKPSIYLRAEVPA